MYIGGTLTLLPCSMLLQVQRELAAHTGYLSCCRFINDDGSHVITSSGDMCCMLWDVESGQNISQYNDHHGDVMSICQQPSVSHPKIFVSGACDAEAKVWDINKIGSVRSFRGHESDINAVSFFPDGIGFGTGIPPLISPILFLSQTALSNAHATTY
jgi:guanine nucleotide-binding protein G(I)/G(S)/G(T) subunit beta-1